MTNIILPFPKKVKGINENILQEQLFTQLDRQGLLKVKVLGASATVFREDKTLMRVIYLDPASAEKICNAMNEYFETHAMVTWKAKMETVQLF